MRVLAIAGAVSLVVPVAHADPTPFDRGKVGVSLGGGTTSTLGHHYILLGGGVGYYVLDGVEVALSGVEEFGDGPNISDLSPSLRYVAQPLVGKWPAIPYAGVFYNHWFVGDGLPDVDTVGARAGALSIQGRILVGLGVVYEHIVSECSTDCASWYPDITLGFTF
jgi:hypothetical protein